MKPFRPKAFALALVVASTGCLSGAREGGPGAETSAGSSGTGSATGAATSPSTSGTTGGGGSGAGGPSCDGGLPDGGVWTMPSFLDCDCSCPGGGVRAIGILDDAVYEPTKVQGNTLEACSCEFGAQDLTVGCSTAADCAFVPADCCGLQNYGSSVAIMRNAAAEWSDAMTSYCQSLPYGQRVCAFGTMTPDAGPFCLSGRCETME
jgi:hypothetical protein